VSLASADCRGFLFLGQEKEKLNAEFAEFRRGSFGMKRFVLLGLAAVCGAMVAAAAGSQHTVSVTLNYDFSVDNACSSSVTTGCVKQFNIYDITGGGTPVKLFSIAAPGGANSAVTGITGTSGPVTIRSGVHTFAATAQMADGTESSPNGSTATAGVAPGSPASFSVVVQ
jgi:hypothetical protein